MRRLTLLTAAFALAAAPAIVAVAQQQGQQADRPQSGQQQQIPGEQPMDDRIFAMAAAASGMSEIGISRLAMQKTDDDQVRQFAERIIEDHTQANQKLTELARSKGIELPQQPDLMSTASAMALAGCSPETFAEEYFKQQEASHILAVGLFKAQAERGQDEGLRAFASESLPKLEEHLQMARQHSGNQDRSGSTAPAGDADNDR